MKSKEVISKLINYIKKIYYKNTYPCRCHGWFLDRLSKIFMDNFWFRDRKRTGYSRELGEFWSRSYKVTQRWQFKHFLRTNDWNTEKAGFRSKTGEPLLGCIHFLNRLFADLYPVGVRIVSVLEATPLYRVGGSLGKTEDFFPFPLVEITFSKTPNGESPSESRFKWKWALLLLSRSPRDSKVNQDRKCILQSVSNKFARSKLK